MTTTTTDPTPRTPDALRITGRVTADDGSYYEPLVWADAWTLSRMLDAITSTAHRCGDTYTLTVDRGPGTPTTSTLTR